MGALADFIAREFREAFTPKAEPCPPANVANPAKIEAGLATLATLAAQDPRNSNPLAGVHLTAERVADQIRRNAARRNEQAIRAGITDRFCTVCGDYAAAEWPMAQFRTEWRCPHCAPIQGRA